MDGRIFLVAVTFQVRKKVLFLLHKLFVHFMHLPLDLEKKLLAPTSHFAVPSFNYQKMCGICKVALLVWNLGQENFLAWPFANPKTSSYRRSKNMVFRSLIKKIYLICLVDMGDATLPRLQCGSLYASFPHHSCRVGKDEWKLIQQ